MCSNSLEMEKVREISQKKNKRVKSFGIIEDDFQKEG